MSHNEAFNSSDDISVQPEWPGDTSHWCCYNLLCLSSGEMRIMLDHVAQDISMGFVC